MANADLLGRVFAVLSAADVDALVDLYTDDYVLELPYAKPEARRVEGLDAVVPYLRRAFEIVRFTLTITEVYDLASGDGAVAEYTSTGRNLQQDTAFANRYIGLWRFRGDRVCFTREFYDPMRAAT